MIPCCVLTSLGALFKKDQICLAWCLLLPGVLTRYSTVFVYSSNEVKVIERKKMVYLNNVLVAQKKGVKSQ